VAGIFFLEIGEKTMILVRTHLRRHHVSFAFLWLENAEQSRTLDGFQPDEGNIRLHTFLHEGEKIQKNGLLFVCVK
jgi:hypothetical protein